MNTTIFGLALLVMILFLLWRRCVKILKETKFSNRSLSSIYGKTTEQFMPFLNVFGYDPKNFRFLGSPIDGVQFNEDEIVFIEFKSISGRLSNKQSQIKKIIENKRVRFEEKRI